MPHPIQTPRLTLQSVTAADENDICARRWHSDVRRGPDDAVLLPLEAVRETISESLDASSSTAFWRIAPATAHSDTIGLIGLKTPSVAAGRLRAIGWRSLELWVALDPAHWGKGYASEAIRAIAGYAAEDGVTFALLASVDVPNQRAHALMRRCRFAELGRIDGTARPLVVYELAV